MKASRASEITQEQINGALSPSQFPTFHFYCFTDIPEDLWLGFTTSRFSNSVCLSVTYGAGPSSGEHPLPPRLNVRGGWSRPCV